MKARGFEPVPPEETSSNRIEHAFECEFAGLRLIIEPGVFEPGPVSRAVVDELVARTAGMEAPVVVDVGTGTGAIALAFAARRPTATVYALDVSADAVACAQANAERLQIRNVIVKQGSLLEPVQDKHGAIDVIVSNIPWVPDAIAAVKELLRPDRWRGPRFTIVGTERDGLGLVREIVRQARPLLRPDGILILEMDDWQTDVFAREYAADYDVVISQTRHFVTLRRLNASRQPGL